MSVLVWGDADDTRAVVVLQVIRTRLERRGTGVEGDPVRILTQYWKMDGTLLVEIDPIAELVAQPPAVGPALHPLDRPCNECDREIGQPHSKNCRWRGVAP